MGVISGALGQLAVLLPGSARMHAEADLLFAEMQAITNTLASSRLLLLFLLVAALYVLHLIFIKPLLYYRRNPEVGYITAPKQSLVERADEVRRRRQTGDLPPVYPNGWYRICEAKDLKLGDVKQVHILGRDLAVFRTETGKVGCTDAYCPHLGANLAAGGTVCGERLQCPFHGWEFNTEGKCEKIPYSQSKIPEQAKVDAYKILEINDQILFWFDAEGREPTWMPPELTKVENKSWTWRGITQHFVNAHIQEVPENAADVAHLNYLHGPILLSGTDLRDTHGLAPLYNAGPLFSPTICYICLHLSSSFSFMKHTWEASWAPEKEADRSHLSVLNLMHRIEIFGVHIPPLDLHVTATQVGPALVYLTWKSFAGEGVFVQSLTPQEPLLQELTHNIYASGTVPNIVAKFYLAGEAKQVERDVMVWNNKMYRKNPILVKEDKLIAQHRKWYQQFYSENSPTLESIKSGDLSW